VLAHFDSRADQADALLSLGVVPLTMRHPTHRLVKDFSKTSQFIFITHNKRTMETANTLYGITMETPGVSKVVSVRLN
jgi:hypothetical protein